MRDQNRKIQKSYVIMDISTGNFWDGICFTRNSDRYKFFKSREEAEEEIESGKTIDFKSISSVMEVYSRA